MNDGSGKTDKPAKGLRDTVGATPHNARIPV